ncbi:hypothetical protein EMCRGX_G026843 [Ephydatia muelleri]
MAAFIRLWDKRGCVLDEIVAFSQDAEKFRESEFNAALKIQSWYRGCRLRAYVRRLHKCALVIQRNYRGRLGRNRYRRRLKCLEERRQRYYDTMATKIQRTWRGFYVRKFVFDYYKYHQQMAQVVLTNEAVRAEATSFWQLTEDTRLSQEEHHLEAQALGEARRLHFMLSTQSKNGVFRPFGKSLPIEAQMKSLRLSQEKKPFGRKGQKTLTFLPRGPAECPSKADGSNSIGLPPLLTPRPQGPFLSSEKVWKYRTRSLNPTLRVATAFNSVEEARAEMKAKEWRERIVEERFKPFSKRPVTYEPMLHTKSSFEKVAYGTVRFRDEEPSANISSQPFRTLVPTSPYFNSETY